MTPLICFQPTNWAVQPRCSASPPPASEASKTPRRPRAASETQPQVSVILMRHGQTDWNYAGRVQGGLDKSRLTHVGMRQARQAGSWLRYLKVDTVFCSPLTRARDTLRLATDSSRNKSLQARKPEVLQSLKEIEVPWQGMQKQDIPNSLFSKAYLQYSRNPTSFSYNGFSPLLDITRRARNVWSTIDRSNGACKLLVSHNQMNKALICSALGLPTVLTAWRQGNCCFNVFILGDGKFPKLRLCNGGDDEEELCNRRKLPVRPRCVRIFLHQKGGSEGLRCLVGNAKISTWYLAGNTPQHDLQQLANPDLEAKCTRLPFETADNASMYKSATEILDQLRITHHEENIVISVNDSLACRAFFAASIGLREDGIERLVSDAGGVSLMDIQVAGPVGKAVTYIEYYNIGAWMKPEAFVSYTRHRRGT